MKSLRTLSHALFPVLGEVWMLHRITDAVQDCDARCNGSPCADWTITPAQLEGLISKHLAKGYRFISVDEVLDEISSPISSIKLLRRNVKWICVTLDDGYEDNVLEAVPILRKYSVPYCIYIAYGFLGGFFTPRTDSPKMMSRAQLIDLSRDPLCTIGAHTVSHPDMALLPFEEQLFELVRSREQLESLCQKEILHCAIPGGPNPDKAELALQAGFSTQVNGWGGPVRFGCNPLDIPRIIPNPYKPVI